MIIRKKERTAVIHKHITGPPLAILIRLPAQESIYHRRIPVPACYLHDAITPLPGHGGRTM